jgi:hypothetical protein
MSKITYSEQPLVGVKVYSGGLRVGTIRRELSADRITYGYRYYPKGNKVGGDLFFSLVGCKRSLEND